MPHIHDRIDFCADVYVVFKDKVLLRKHDKYNIWLHVGGHIELDEDPTQAAIREAKEEVGLDIILAKPPYPMPQSGIHVKQKYAEGLPPDVGSIVPPRYVDRHWIDQNHEHVSFIYFATSTTDTLDPAQGDEAAECRWFTRQDLEINEVGISPGIIFYASRALDELAS